MDEKDFKRLLEASATETQRRFDETTERLSAEMRTFVDANAAETRLLFDTRTAEITNRFDASTAELKEHFDTRSAEMKQYMDKTAEKLRLHFDTTAEDMRHQVQLIAERVVMVDERLEREAADIRAEMRQGFADTQAMIKFSHAELDRRIHAVEDRARTLEENVIRLQARMDRLEAMTATQ